MGFRKARPASPNNSASATTPTNAATEVTMMAFTGEARFSLISATHSGRMRSKPIAKSMREQVRMNGGMSLATHMVPITNIKMPKSLPIPAPKTP